ncbi:MAG: DUF3995 domain-containing protein [Microbacteriaceae bacterium]
MTTRTRTAAALFTAAAVAGLTHAGFSIYWACGGTALLDTIGAWGPELQHDDPARFAVTFAAIGTVKILASLLPPLTLWPRLPLRRTLRGISWVGAGALLLMSLWTITNGILTLTGVTPVPDGATLRSTLWTATLWHPLFLIWAITLMWALALTRKRTAADEH